MQIKFTFIDRKSARFKTELFTVFFFFLILCKSDCLQESSAQFADDAQLTLQAENQHPRNPELRVVKLHHDSQCASNFERGASAFMKPRLHLQFL